MLINYDLLVHRLRCIVKENLYVEDDKLYVKSKCKYDIVNLMEEIDTKYMKELLKELEYNEQ